MQKWQKKGKVFEPDGSLWWMQSHASNPVPLILDNGLVRVFFSGRGDSNKAYISYVDLDFENDYKVVNVCSAPILELGERGAFDDSGMSVGCILLKNNLVQLYYLGWNLGLDVPFRNAIGLAVEQTDNSFKRYAVGPLLDRSLSDPFSLSYPFILYDEGLYKMWYGSHKKWGKTTNDMIHHLKYAESIDGIHWVPKDVICLHTTVEHYAFSKPCVIKENGLYKMWYSYRGGKYRIGYAESTDGLVWKRKDSEVNLSMSEKGWDSNMLCYAYVFDYNNKRFMLYNGNGYGKSGLGLAECVI
jgi:hypothetical protein